MNIHRERYEKWGNLISKNKRLTLKELEYYIKFNEAWDYPKKFTIMKVFPVVIKLLEGLKWNIIIINLFQINIIKKLLN